jgi:hypothetical protein
MMKRVCIETSHDHPTLAYAARECRSFLEKTTALEMTGSESDADYLFRLVLDPGLAETQYAIRIDHGAGTAITLRGHDEACVLHALYDTLESAGVTFDVLGPILPDSIDLNDLPAGERVVTPFVKRRGIRQHINFAMDISSYPLEEALDYIRNLARMWMNHITFHSYSGQWFGYSKDGVFHPGGNFFYGTRHVLPQREPFVGAIRNRAVYCIPEIEPIIDQPEERSRAATEWLNAVMAECKRVGMHVQLSIEPPGETHDEGLAICREVLDLYPQIDALELITPECGDSVRTMDVDELKAFVVELFGPDALDESLLNLLKPDLEQLEGGLRHVARNVRLAEELLAADRASEPRTLQLVVGAYITCPDTLRILHALMQRYTPPGVWLSFLPAHGARRAVVNLKQMGFTTESLGRSMLYSWIEFDGNMYLQQNSVTGTKQLLAFAGERMAGDQVAMVALNHWRTAENRTCIAYAARAFIRGPIDPHDFYLEYAKAFGTDDTSSFAAIMQEIDELDDLAREKLFNIGFCASICWVRPGLRWTKQWDDPSIDICRERFGAVRVQLDECLATATTPRGREQIRFLMNRVACSIHQLDCAQAMKSLAGFCDHDQPDALTDEQRNVVSETCASAMAIAQRYLRRHAEAIVDRGCEGTLISYETTIPNFIDHIRAVFVEGEEECSHILPQFDEPPPPMVN